MSTATVSTAPNRRGPLGPPHRVAPAWVGDLIGAVVIIGSAFIPFPNTQFRPAAPIEIVLVLLPALVLPLRRRWPVPVLGATVALYALAVFSAALWPGVILAIALAMFTVATQSARRPAATIALITIAAIVVINVVASLSSLIDLRAFAVAVTVAFAAAVGDATRSGREYIAAITERAERAEQTRESEARRRVSEERLRIARDLHDAVAHQIAVISLNAGVASSAIDARPETAHAAVRTIREAARTVLGEIGAILQVLRADDSMSTVAPQPGLDRLDELVGQFADAGLAVTVRTEGDPESVGGATGLVAYRVLQEALTNAHKHGAEGRAHILIAIEDQVRIVVTNPVVPSHGPNAAGGETARSGLGLIGVRERVAVVGGSVESGPATGGWRLAASLPSEEATIP